MNQRFLKTYNYLFHHQAVLIKRCLSFAVVLSVVYCVLVVKTINVISDRKDMKTQISHAQGRISELETKYFEIASAIDSTYVHTLGFTEVDSPIFAYTYDARRADTNLALGKNINTLK